MLEQYFRHVLKQSGFNDVRDVLWSLGCCQGDGCSFTGDFDVRDMVNLMPYLFPEDKNNAIHRVGNLISRQRGITLVNELNCSFTIEQSGRYVHENTMSVEFVIGAPDMDDREDDCCDLADRVLVYAQSIAKKLEANGYAILDAFNREEKEIWRFKTAKYLFRLLEFEENIEDNFMSDWDERCLISTCEEMISGKTLITGLKADVFLLQDVEEENCLEKCEPLAEASLNGVSCQPGDCHSTCRRDLVSELIFDVREFEKKSNALPLAFAA